MTIPPDKVEPPPGGQASACKYEIDLDMWNALRASADSGFCDDLHTAIARKLRNDEVLEQEKMAWSTVEPILALFVNGDLVHEEPFRPANVFHSLDEEVLRELSDALAETDHHDLRARCLDLCWTKPSIRDHEAGATAIDAYLRAVESDDSDDWPRRYRRLKRAIEVGLSLGRNNGPYQDAVDGVKRIAESLSKEDETLYPHRIVGLLHHHGEPSAEYADLVGELAAAARARYQADGVAKGLNHELERAYLDLEMRLCGADASRVKEVRRALAASYENQAIGVLEAEWPKCKLVAVLFLEHAITTLRSAGPGQEEKLTDLMFRRETLQREAAEAFVPVASTSRVSSASNAARAAVSGVTPVEAIVALASSYAPPTESELMDEVRKMSGESRFAMLIPNSYLGPRGNVLARRDGFSPGREDTPALELEKLRVAYERQQATAAAFLHPAAEQVRYEHGLDLGFFLLLCAKSFFVPAGREVSFARGLVAGANGDYELGAALLFPQFEHGVREAFYQQGVVTRSLPSDGIQNEHDLNKLLYFPEAAELLDEALVFDLRALLIEKAGGNLRNSLAHGLVADYAQWHAKIYFWWTCLRFVVLSAFRDAPVAKEHRVVSPDESGTAAWAKSAADVRDE